jgi:hypothetical protein
LPPRGIWLHRTTARGAVGALYSSQMRTRSAIQPSLRGLWSGLSRGGIGRATTCRTRIPCFRWRADMVTNHPLLPSSSGKTISLPVNRCRRLFQSNEQINRHLRVSAPKGSVSNTHGCWVRPALRSGLEPCRYHYSCHCGRILEARIIRIK